MKTFFLNGQEYNTEGNFTLLELLHYFNYDFNLLVIEHNYLIRKKQNWGQIFINNNDRIEIVTIVGGG
uniref:Thiamine biosynthesis protein S n=1 Tax=Actinocyclus subtilis TaxID=1630683 RepID=A0A2U9NQ91_9STRA|nr:thiamine biosynthesis protein S [Actinocyclus subtilis]AWT39281.1 thiamine biosynthesis protein S [Actinocyclus subtilis]